MEINIKNFKTIAFVSYKAWPLLAQFLKKWFYCFILKSIIM